MIEQPLGRREPTDFRHVEKYPSLAADVATVERRLSLTRGWRVLYNQGREGSCVGHASSFAMSILNRRQYDAWALYRAAQLVDEWDDTPPAEGTSVRAAMDVLRLYGHRRLFRGVSQPTRMEDGIESNRWARTVDEMRASIAAGTPVVLGVNWYRAFDTPVRHAVTGEHWIGRGDLGRLRGGHAICAFAASDRRQAFRLVNSWGLAWPLVWMPYDTVDRLLREQGEAALITDRVPV